jgi:hypothetical protein
VKRRIGLVALALVLVAAGLAWQRVKGPASVGAGYVAKEVCSCVFVGGRSLESCLLDVPESMARIRAEVLPDGVRAFVTGIASPVARHEPEYGCTLLP